MKKRATKLVDSLTVADLSATPVWQYTPARGEDLLIRAARKLPVKNLTGKLVGTRVSLANGSEVWATLGNIDIQNLRLTKHFLTLSAERGGKWFHLARYHDPDFKSRGPAKLARFLDLKLDEVFPISYDIRALVEGKPRGLAGTITSEHQERLSRDEIIVLAVPGGRCDR